MKIYGVAAISISITSRYRLVSVSYTPISTVVTERKPAQAAERIYRNSSDDPEPNKHTYTHQKDSSKRRLSGTTNMQGLEVENELTVGTGEHASVKVENKTKISVKAEFSQTQERETTDTDTEVDTTEVYVLPGMRNVCFKRNGKASLKKWTKST